MTEITKEQMDVYTTDQARRETVYDWRNTCSKQMPEVMARVFALRDSGYYGCGYHYGMEARAGTLMARMSPEREVTMAGSIGDRLAWDMLIDDIEKAEESSAFRFDAAGEQEAKQAAIFNTLKARLEPAMTANEALTFLRLFDRASRRSPGDGGRVEMWLMVARGHFGAHRAAVKAGYVTQEGHVTERLVFAVTPKGEAALADYKAKREQDG